MPPRLLTLGQLKLGGLDFKREKPLLLLAYLCLSGIQLRRRVAQQFWPDAANPMNSLAVAVAQLRRADPELIGASETHLHTALPCDVQAFREALAVGDLGAAAALYQGPFLADLRLAELPEELEEWVMTTREDLADTYRRAWMAEARRQSGQAEQAAAAQAAARAYRLGAATPLPPELLRELYNLLSAAQHPDAHLIEQEARGLGLTLTPQDAGAAPLLGRRHELARLGQLRAGETLWVCGAVGLGKSALLRASALGSQLSGGQLLLGRSGHAFQTLEPLISASTHAPSHSAPASASDWLAFLGARTAPLLLDDWEAADTESRRVLLALAHSRAGPPLIISSRERSALGSGSGLSELTLRPLEAQELGGDLYARTGGLPTLIEAVRQQRPCLEALSGLLAPLTPRARQLLACLTVQVQPDARITGAALQLGPEELAEAHEHLQRAGWLDGNELRARDTLRGWLGAQPSLEAEVLTLLAPQLPPADALPLYLRAQALTGSSELPGFQAALAASAAALLDAEQESEAEGLLAAHARTPETWLLHARALDALGRGPEALKRLADLPRTPDVQAVRSLALWRTGHTEEARHAAQVALSGDLAARARGHMVLGTLALAAQEYPQAKAAFSRACGLFRLLGDDLGYLKLLCQQAVAMTELADDLTATIHEIKMLSAQHPQAVILNNIGWLLERQNEPEQALDFYRQAAQLAQNKQQAAAAALAWNNVGALEQRLTHFEDAEQAYQNAITHARLTGETHTLAMVLGNLGELKGSLPLIEEAIELLRGTGQEHLIAYFEGQRAAFTARSGEI
ncbi:hypothetical protein GCM10022631_41230 [Deinococcus rubellus]|uniref:Tetratricopeptide repeat protein n=1 Tax=Deinococcus rubellus TaxID=1889240 RepID=A0ABY5YID6_9DEIO|nr:hypothetical protein [Deinococcus rubellus]UWX63906.1 hypothetical protein N0D28_14470 [Deinococcus rubellus]